MGVRSETYLIFGWLLDYSKLDDLSEDEQEKIYDLDGGRDPAVGEIARLIDGMSGEYVAVGLVVQKATDDGEGFSPIALSNMERPAIHTPGLLDAGTMLGPNPNEPGYVILTHYH